jgi:hypothetical protein
MRRARAVAFAFLALLGIGAASLAPADAVFSANTTNTSNSLTANGAFPTYYHNKVIANSPFFYHEMDDTSGNTATDSSGNSRSGTYSVSTGSRTFATATGATTGDSDGAITLGGGTANSGVAATGVCGYAVSDSTIATGNTFTIEFWFKAGGSSGGMLVNSGGYTTATGYTGATSVDRWVYLNSSNQLEFGLGSGANDLAAGTYTNATNAGWHLVDAVASNVSGVQTNTLYVDGISIGSTATGDTATHSNQSWRVGCDDTNNLNLSPTNNAFNGSMDDVAIYTTALSQARVTAHYGAKAAATYSTTINSDSPTLYWRLDDPDAKLQLTDSSGNGHTGHYLGIATGGSATLSASGALLHAQSTSTAATYSSAWGVNGTSQNVATGYAATEEAWFKTANGYANGGTILALCNTNSVFAGAYERLLWMDNTGKVNFGAFPSGTVKVISTASSYNDGNWHMVDASVGAAGQKLYIDGSLVASDVTVTAGQADTTAYWRWGYSPYNLWSPIPKSYYFNGTLDEIAVYNTQQADATVAATYAANY